MQKINFIPPPTYSALRRMAPPVAVKKVTVKKQGPAGEGKPDVWSLKRKRVPEDHEKLQKDVQELVSYLSINYAF
jgi:hypothetical protein